MKKLYAWTENDVENQMLKTTPARSSDTLLGVRLEMLETCETADWKSALRSLAPAAYADVLAQRPLPARRHRIPIVFLGPLPQEKEQPVRIGFGPATFPRKMVTKRDC